MYEDLYFVAGLILFSALFLDKLWKKQVAIDNKRLMQEAGVWAEPEFTDAAIQTGSRSYRFAVYDRGRYTPHPVFATNIVSPERMRSLFRRGINVLEADLNKEVPDMFNTVPSRMRSLDQLELNNFID